jgi:hypothetical protein
MVEADALAERKRDYVRGRVLSEELTMHLWISRASTTATLSVPVAP